MSHFFDCFYLVFSPCLYWFAVSYSFFSLSFYACSWLDDVLRCSPKPVVTLSLSQKIFTSCVWFLALILLIYSLTLINFTVFIFSKFSFSSDPVCFVSFFRLNKIWLRECFPLFNHEYHTCLWGFSPIYLPTYLAENTSIEKHEKQNYWKQLLTTSKLTCFNQNKRIFSGWIGKADWKLYVLFIQKCTTAFNCQLQPEIRGKETEKYSPEHEKNKFRRNANYQSRICIQTN